jgi:hypothetical protein
VRNPQFYLEIPSKHHMFFVFETLEFFLGWCILGVEGRLAEHRDSEQIKLDGALNNKGLYYYVIRKDTGKCSSTHHLVEWAIALHGMYESQLSVIFLFFLSQST